MTAAIIAIPGASSRLTGARPHAQAAPARADLAGAGAPDESPGILHILTCGSVDDGKSTLIGRLLWDACDLPDDTRATLSRSAGPDGVPDFSLLVDGLVAEREQGITIDIAWRYVDVGPRRLVIIDSPGHEQYTRNMASGASHADVAVMLVDARHGVKQQTRRHAAILDLVGVSRVILAVNKMDLVGWSEQRFREIAADFAQLAGRIGFADAIALPVAARTGDNVAARSARLAWYDGPTLADVLAATPVRRQTADHADHGFRMPVQTVLRAGNDFRGLAGTIGGGTLRVGDEVTEVLSGARARVRRIVTMDRDLDAAARGEAVVVELDRDIDISRGALLAHPDRGPALTQRLAARLVWLSDEPFEPGTGLLLRLATDLVPVAGVRIQALIDLSTMSETPATDCAANDIVNAELELSRPAAVDLFSRDQQLGSFVLVHALTGATLAGGVVTRRADAADDDMASQARGDAVFRLTPAMLAGGVCAGLPQDTPEFRRRAEEVAIILAAAGVKVVIAAE